VSGASGSATVGGGAPRPVVVGTSGHIDHGKTALVKRLTGIDTDRLPEEKARGISIELGFAHMRLPGGRQISFVDVPGHERFVKTMLAGAGGIEAVLFVVAADEGVMPQTREHLDIVHFLGVGRGVVALTKSDLVEPDLALLVEEEVRELIRGTSLSGAPLVACSARTGAGLDRLVAALDAVLDRALDAEGAALAGAPFRLPVDRVFSMPGFGTVVTGTPRAGSVAAGDRVVLLPSGKEARVRRVQVHGEDVERARAGERTALALHGVDREEAARGDVVAAPGALVVSHMLDVRLHAAPRLAHPVRNRDRVRYHHGTREVLGRLVLLDREDLAPGESALAQLRLEGPEACLARDRFVLRSYSPQVVIGGGIVLDPAPPKHRRFREGELSALAVRERGDPREVVLDRLARAGARGATRAELAAAAALAPADAAPAVQALVADGRARVVGADRVVLAAALDDVAARLREALRAFHAASPLRIGPNKEDLKGRLAEVAPGDVLEEALRALSAAGEVVLHRDKVRLAAAGEPLAGAGRDLAARVEARLLEARFTPPDAAALAEQAGVPRPALRDLLETLVDLGVLVKVTPEIVYHRALLDEAAEGVRATLAARGELGVADLKERLGVSRKYAVPLLEHLDRLGVTRRSGDLRVAGPRLHGTPRPE
jgi:selenocysteine-specific elongation factor